MALKRDLLLSSPNVAEHLDENELAKLGKRAVEAFERDLRARTMWDEDNAEAFKSVLQVREERTWPWPGASNVRFPLITVAALGFLARAYPALVPVHEVAGVRVIGLDPDGSRGKLGERLSAHMNYQLFEEDREWEDSMDYTLICTGIMGCAFKKSIFDSREKHNISSFVNPRYLVVPYWTKNLDKAPRISHVIYLDREDVYEREARGLFLKCDYDSQPAGRSPPTRLDNVFDEKQGITPSIDEEMPREYIEQYVKIDLDGDGYREPYIVTVDRMTMKVARVVANYFEEDIEFNETGKKIICIKYHQPFIKYSFLPSPDGGFYDLGLAALLAPLNESIDTIINQMIDAGTRQNLGGGLLGRGVRMRGGSTTFQPGEWKKTEASGGSLKDNVFPLPVPEVSPSQLALLELLINYGERVSGSTDTLAGEPMGQNTPASTASETMEAGMKELSGVYRRVWRSLRKELERQAYLNSIYLEHSDTFEDLVNGQVLDISLEDYRAERINVSPTADPDLTSDRNKLAQANALVMTSQGAPGLYNSYQVHRRLVKALKVPYIEEVLPDPKGPNALPPPSPDPRIQVAQMRNESQFHRTEVQARLKYTQMLQQIETNKARVAQLEAMAAQALAQASATTRDGDLKIVQTTLAAIKDHQDSLMSAAEFIRGFTTEGGASEEDILGPSGKPAGGTEGNVGPVEEASGVGGAAGPSGEASPGDTAPPL